MSPSRLNNEEYQTLVATLNNRQRDYLFHVLDHFRKSTQPILHFVTGGAGTGKSRLISALHQTFMRLFDKGMDRDLDKPSVLLCAPTGKAAFNILGQTLHMAFQLPVNQHGHELSVLSADVAHSMATTLAELKVVIIDEVSMMSETMLRWVDQR